MSYRTISIMINQKHYLFSWCKNITALANNLSNAVRFRQRQIITSFNKEEKDWTANEKEIREEFKKAGYDTVPSLTLSVIDNVLKRTNNSDYYAKIPRQSAQNIIKQCVEDMKNYFKAMKSYQKNPSSFTGKPQFPGYKRKQGHCTVAITNQDCPIRELVKGKLFACLPFAKKTPLCIGHPKGRLKEAEVIPTGNIYKINFTFEIEDSAVFSSEHKRIASIDLGVDNLMAVTNNCGIPSLLYKGGIIKSVNHHYNKELARIMSEEAKREGIFKPTEESIKLTRYRNNLIQDQMHKIAKHFITWCVGNRIDTVVVGVNKFWKQEVNIGKVNNQNFVQIPHAKLCHILQYLAEEKGIHYIEQEESYTSKASFMDNDPIPVYGETKGKPVFSGKRRPTRYKGMKKPDGFRGLYECADGTIINSDLNGSANILRKAFPHAFESHMPDFENVLIFKNVDKEFIIWNQREQLSKKKLSNSKLKRIKKVIPLG